MSSLRPSWEVSTEGDQGRTSLSPSPKSSSEDWFQPTLLGSTQCQWRKVKPLGVELTRCNNRPPADLGPTQQRRDPSLFSMQLCEDGKTTGTGCTSMEVPGDEVEPMVDARLPAPQATQGRFLRKVDFAERMRDSFVETTVHALRGVELKETCETTVTIPVDGTEFAATERHSGTCQERSRWAELLPRQRCDVAKLWPTVSVDHATPHSQIRNREMSTVPGRGPDGLLVPQQESSLRSQVESCVTKERAPQPAMREDLRVSNPEQEDESVTQERLPGDHNPQDLYKVIIVKVCTECNHKKSYWKRLPALCPTLLSPPDNTLPDYSQVSTGVDWDLISTCLTEMSQEENVLNAMGSPSTTFGASNLPDPPPPQPLLFVPVLLEGTCIRALVDSGASDSFIGEEVVAKHKIATYPLRIPLTVKAANGGLMSVTRYVIVKLKIGELPVRLKLRVIRTPLSMVLGYPFLYQFTPRVDWRKRVLYIRRRNELYVIPALPAVDSYRLGWNPPRPSPTGKLNVAEMEVTPPESMP